MSEPSFLPGRSRRHFPAAVGAEGVDEESLLSPLVGAAVADPVGRVPGVDEELGSVFGQALFGQAGDIGRNSQAEVTYLDCAVIAEHHVAWLQVAVYYSLRMSELKTLADGFGDFYSLLKGKPMFGCFLYQPFNITTGHQFGDYVRLTVLLTEVINRNDSCVLEGSDGLRLAGKARYESRVMKECARK